MELPRRSSGDELLKPGELVDIRLRLRKLAAKNDLTTVIACAFDHRTRMLPFIVADTHMIPAGVRAVGSSMLDAGFAKTRIVLQQWNRNFRPSQMRLDGKIPDIFMISSMQIHDAQCRAMIQDACRIDPAHRPLIIVGGPKVIYEPWDVFGTDPQNPWTADVAVTGEDYILLNMLEVLLEARGTGESMRDVFARTRDAGMLDDIPGLVYARGTQLAAEELIDTGIQRLAGDLDELPDPVLGYSIVEPPSKKATLDSQTIPVDRIHRYSMLGSLVLTLGCKFNCPYCPIPAYNQRQYRAKSGERIAWEFERLYKEYHIKFFFGADDNFFNDEKRTLDITETLARKVDAGSRPHSKIRWATEATIHDVVKMKEHLPVIRKAGLWGLWLGVEDMSGALVKKGQSADQTLDAFRLMRKNGILPIPMMMHHDSQPLYSFKGNAGLLNQVGMLRKAGALYTQILMLTPSPGSKLFVETYTSGLAYKSVDGITITPQIVDGNHVVASRAKSPWKKQFNLLAAYIYFYNPIRFLIALVFSKSNIAFASAETCPSARGVNAKKSTKLHKRITRKLRAHFTDAAIQVFGMWGLLHTVRRTFIWAMHLMKGDIERCTKVPTSKVPMRSPDNSPAAHAIPGTPMSQPVPEPKEKITAKSFRE